MIVEAAADMVYRNSTVGVRHGGTLHTGRTPLCVSEVVNVNRNP